MLRRPPAYIRKISASVNHTSSIILNTLIGALAQLVERLPCTQEVSGSTPLGSTIF